MSDADEQFQEQIEHVGNLIREGNQPYVQAGTMVTMHVGTEEHPVGVVIAAYQQMCMEVASIAEGIVAEAEASKRHSWALTAQNVLCLFLALAFILVLFKGWP